MTVLNDFDDDIYRNVELILIFRSDCENQARKRSAMDGAVCL